MRRSLFLGVCVAPLVACLASACSSSTATTPTPVSPAASIETFSGTITLNGAITFPFSVTQAGSVNAAITAMDPDQSAVMQAGGTGAFTVGEAVYQGNSLTDNTARGTVYAWDGVNGLLSIKDITGAFIISTPVIGADSGAQWSPTVLNTPVLGMALGTWSGTVCSLVGALTSDIASTGSTISGQVQGAGSLCLRIYDVGKITEAATFTASVTHF